MIKKESLYNFISQYNLTGLVESSILTVEDNVLSTIFKTPAGDLRGRIVLEDFQFEDSIVGIYTTTELLKLFSIVEGDLEISAKYKNNDKTQIITTLKIIDNFKKEFQYATANPAIIESDTKTGKITDYDIEINIDKQLIQDILKASAAIASKSITFVVENGVLFVVFNYSDGNENKISFEISPTKLDKNFDFMSFDLNVVQKILNVNNFGKFTEGKICISNKGLICFKYQNDVLKLNSEYWLLKLKD